MKSFWINFKLRLGIESDWQAFIICVVFALTGSTALIVRPYFLRLLGFDPATINIFLRILLIIPVYYIFILIYGFIFGQFDFFWNMVKKTFGRFGKLFGR